MATIRIKGTLQPIIVSLNQAMQVKSMWENVSVRPDEKIEVAGHTFEKRDIRFVILETPSEKTNSDRKVKYDPYDPTDREKIRAFEREWLAWYAKNEKPLEYLLEEKGAIRITGQHVMHDYSIRNPALYEDLWALWNAYGTLDWMREQAKRGIRLRRDSWMSVMYAEGLNSTTRAATFQRTDRHEIWVRQVALKRK